MDDQVFVADLGTTKVACLAVSMGENYHLKVDAAAVVPCRGLNRGTVADIEVTAEALEQALGKVERDLGVRIETLTVNISGTHLKSDNAQGFVPIYPQSRPIRREDVLQVVNHSRQIMMPPDREQIMAIPREFRVDGQRGVSRPVGLNGSRLEVMTHIITGQTTHVQNVERTVLATGRQVGGMVVGALASGLGVLSADAMDIGCVVIDIGGSTTDVAVFAGGAIAYTASIPIGANHVTSDVATLLKTTLEEAERLKVAHGCALASMVGNDDIVEISQLETDGPRPMKRKVLCEICESRMREIGQFVQNHIERSGMNGLLPGGALITGGGSQLYGTEGLMSECLRHIKARVAQPKLTGSAAKVAANPAMACAVGLGRYALESDDQEFAPVSGHSSWKDKIRTLKSMFGGRS